VGLSVTSDGCAPRTGSNRPRGSAAQTSESHGQAVVGKRPDHAVAAGGHDDRAPRGGDRREAVAQLRPVLGLRGRGQLLLRPRRRPLGAVGEGPRPRGPGLAVPAQSGRAGGFLGQAGRLGAPVLVHTRPWHSGGHVLGEEQLARLN
jgi:hypothetical protein